MSVISSPNWASATVYKRSDRHGNVACWVRRPELFLQGFISCSPCPLWGLRPLLPASHEAISVVPVKIKLSLAIQGMCLSVPMATLVTVNRPARLAASCWLRLFSICRS
jgi:hypothetical protein